MKKYYVKLDGGLGDIIAKYYLNTEMTTLAHFRKNNPDTYFKLLLLSQNAAACDFFRFCPWFEEVHYLHWDHHMHHDWLAQQTAGYEPYFQEGPKEHPPIYLSHGEEQIVQSIQAKGKYVTFQPFAGEDHRHFYHIFDVPHLVDVMREEGYNVVVVGGKSPKRWQDTHWPQDNCDGYEDKVTNLIPLSNVRICAAVVARAERHFGTDSCFGCLAFLNKVHSLISTSNTVWTTGLPLLMTQSKYVLNLHFDIFRRGELEIDSVLRNFLSPNHVKVEI